MLGTPWWILAAAIIVIAGCHDKGAGARDPDGGDDTTEHDCDDGYIADGAECVPEACGTGTWGDLDVDTSTVFVDRAAGPGGDGSESAPFDTIQAALDAAGGGMVAIAAGNYYESLEIGSGHAGTWLAGRCADLVAIDGSRSDEEDPAVFVSGGAGDVFDITGVTVTGGRDDGVDIWGGDVWLSQVVVEANRVRGVMTHGYKAAVSLVLEDVEIRDTRAALDYYQHDSWYGHGLVVGGGSSVTATNVVLSGNLMGIATHAPTTLLDVEVRDCVVNPDGVSGIGIGVYSGSRVQGAACRVDNALSFGVVVIGEGADTVFVDLDVTSTQPSKWGATGVEVDMEGRLELSNARIVDNADVGVKVAGAYAELTDSIVDGNTMVGVVASYEGTEVVLDEVTVTDTSTDEDGDFGYGVRVTDGASLSATSSMISGNHLAGVFAEGADTQVVLDDVTVSGTLRGTAAEVAFGLAVEDDAVLTATGVQTS